MGGHLQAQVACDHLLYYLLYSCCKLLQALAQPRHAMYQMLLAAKQRAAHAKKGAADGQVLVAHA